jgi:hypothetical protein
VLRSNERGVSIVLVAGSLLLLFGIAAIAIDYSAALNERRQDVGAADTAALGGILEGALSGSVSAIQDAVDEAKSIAATNNDKTITDADWAACTDPEPLPIPSNLPVLGVTGSSPCISFDENFTTMRVLLPDQETDTSFGGLLGVDSIATTAAAEASLTVRTFPAATYSGAAPGDLVCMATVAHGSAPVPGNCNGDLDYLQPFIPVPYVGGSACSGSFLPLAMVTDISHSFGASSGGGSRPNGCTGGVGRPFPNQVTSAFIPPLPLTQGMLGPGGGSGRLALAPTDPSMTVFGRSINNNPLWVFIDTSVALDPSCATIAQLPAHPSNAQFNAIGISTGPADTPWQAAENLLVNCLTSQAGVLFTEAIFDAPRFVTVPQLHLAAPVAAPSGIRSFHPAYLHGIFVEAAVPADSCSPAIFQGTNFCRHQAGMRGSITSTGAGPAVLSSVHALVLRCEHLPDQQCSRATSGWERTYVMRIELVR